MYVCIYLFYVIKYDISGPSITYISVCFLHKTIINQNHILDKSYYLFDILHKINADLIYL